MSSYFSQLKAQPVDRRPVLVIYKNRIADLYFFQALYVQQKTHRFLDGDRREVFKEALEDYKVFIQETHPSMRVVIVD